jgi:hypothetical protein
VRNPFGSDARTGRRRLLAAVVVGASFLCACGSGDGAARSTNLERPGPSSTRTSTFPVSSSPTSPTDGGTIEPPASPTPTSTRTPFEPDLGCPNHALLGVYQPERFHVVARCQWFVGIVAGSIRLRDGDVQIFAVPTRPYQRFLNATNRSVLGGRMIVEIIQGQAMMLFIPGAGDRISAFGTVVRDVAHGWNAMHPVWEIRYPDSGTTIYATPPDPPLYHPGAG